MKKYTKLVFVSLCSMLLLTTSIIAGCSNTKKWVIYDSSKRNAVICNTKTCCVFPVIRLDNTDNPHITFYADTFGDYVGDIVYMKWDGSRWVNADNSKFGFGKMNADNPANITKNTNIFWDSDIVFELDKNDNPTFLWSSYVLTNKPNYNSSVDISCIKWDETNWVSIDKSVYDPNLSWENTAVISKTHGGSRRQSLVIDKKGYPHITWAEIYPVNQNFYSINYIHWNGENWVCIDGSIYNEEEKHLSNAVIVLEAGYPTLFLNKDDHPIIIWRDNITRESEDMMYIRWNGDNWVCLDGSIFNRANKEKTNPAIIFHCKKNETLDSNAIAVVDDRGFPHVVWTEMSSFKHRYNTYFVNVAYKFWDGNNWLCANGTEFDPDNAELACITTRAADLHCADIVLDTENKPHISWSSYYQEMGTKDFVTSTLYVKWNGENWLCADKSVFDPDVRYKNNPANLGDGQHGRFVVSFELDDSNYPHFVWGESERANNRNEQLDKIMYIKWDGENWVTPAK